MATNQDTYNTRLTDEALEKRFRDTFRSQSGAELVDDLYASGVIVPVVDFTAAAEGSSLRTDLQKAWDFSTGQNQLANSSATIISTSGFWLLEGNAVFNSSAAGTDEAVLYLTDGVSNKFFWRASTNKTTIEPFIADLRPTVVFVRANDSIIAASDDVSIIFNVSYRQIADVYGNLTQPSGFTSS